MRYQGATGAEVVGEIQQVLGCRADQTGAWARVTVTGLLELPRAPGIDAQTGYCVEQQGYVRRDCYLFAGHGDLAVVAKFTGQSAKSGYPWGRDALAAWLAQASPLVEAAFLRM